jgi:hypothetical protein
MRLTTILKLLAVVSVPGAILTLILYVAGWFQLEGPVYTLLIVAVHSVIALGQATARERGKARWLMTIGLVVSALAAGSWMWMVITWDALFNGLTMSQFPTGSSILTGWAAMLMVAGMSLAQAARSKAARALQIGTVVLALLIGAIWMPTSWALAADAPEMEDWGRAVALLSLLAVAGLIANLVMALSSQSAGSEAVDDGRRIEAACPRCGHWQTLRLGGTECRRCALRIKVQLP